MADGKMNEITMHIIHFVVCPYILLWTELFVFHCLMTCALMIREEIGVQSIKRQQSGMVRGRLR